MGKAILVALLACSPPPPATCDPCPGKPILSAHDPTGEEWSVCYERPLCMMLFDATKANATKAECERVSGVWQSLADDPYFTDCLKQWKP